MEHDGCPERHRQSVVGNLVVIGSNVLLDNGIVVGSNMDGYCLRRFGDCECDAAVHRSMWADCCLKPLVASRPNVVAGDGSGDGAD